MHLTSTEQESLFNSYFVDYESALKPNQKFDYQLQKMVASDAVGNNIGVITY